MGNVETEARIGMAPSPPFSLKDLRWKACEPSMSPKLVRRDETHAFGCRIFTFEEGGDGIADRLKRWWLRAEDHYEHDYCFCKSEDDYCQHYPNIVFELADVFCFSSEAVGDRVAIDGEIGAIVRMLQCNTFSTVAL
jgi:hypothetical protein